jgi:hypothetical protein
MDYVGETHKSSMRVGTAAETKAFSETAGTEEGPQLEIILRRFGNPGFGLSQVDPVTTTRL